MNGRLSKPLLTLRVTFYFTWRSLSSWLIKLIWRVCHSIQLFYELDEKKNILVRTFIKTSRILICYFSMNLLSWLSIITDIQVSKMYSKHTDLWHKVNIHNLWRTCWSIIEIGNSRLFFKKTFCMKTLILLDSYQIFRLKKQVRQWSFQVLGQMRRKSFKNWGTNLKLFGRVTNISLRPSG